VIAGLCAVALVLYACLAGHGTTIAPTAPAVPPSSQAESIATPAGTEPAIPAGTLRLEGLVVDTADKPIGGATVRLADRVAISEADGSFAFDAVAAGRYSLSAQADELYGEVNDAKLDDTSDPVEITIRGGPSVVLHVRDVAGSPIANAKASTSAREGITDRDGTTTLRSVDEGLELITVSAPGFAESELRVEASGQVVVERTVTLYSGATVSGIVLGPDEKPITDAHVEIDGTHTTIVVPADPDGRWHLEDIPAGPHRIAASSSRFLAADPLVVTTDGVHVKSDVVLHVRPGAEIAGIVVDTAGAPVAGASVYGSGSSDNTDEHGRFTLVGLEAGKTDVSASTSRGATRPFSIELENGGHAEIRLVLVMASLAGVLRDSRGNAIEQAAVAASSVASMDTHVVHTDDHGHFDLGGVVPGDYEISVRRPHRKHGFATVKTVTADNRNLVIVLPDAVTVTGRVVANGKPATNAGVIVTDTPHNDRSTPTMVDPKTGRFVVDDLEQGPWGAIVAAPGFAPKRITPVPGVAGARLDFGDIVLDAGRSIRGRVVDDTGRGVASARVAVYVKPNAGEGLLGLFAGTLETRSDAGGDYVISGIESRADTRIVATHPTVGVSTDRVLGPTESQVDLVLAASGSIGGTIENMSAGQSGVIATSDSGLRADADIDPAGGFRFDGLHPGEYQVLVYGPSELPPQRVTVGAGQTTMVVFTADRSH